MKEKLPASSQTYEILGWVGVVFVLGSYYLLATGMIDGNSWVYHALVLTGSVFIAVISYIRRVFQPMVLNVCFSLLALFALIRLLFL